MDKTKSGARPELEVKTVTIVMYVGADGCHYDTSDEARWSFARQLIADIIDDAVGNISDCDLFAAVDALRARKDDVIAWLKQV